MMNKEERKNLPKPTKTGCTATGHLLDAAGRKLAEGRAQMTYLSGKRVPLLPEAYRTEMEKLFDQLRELVG
jgi:hypothetical protein